MPEVRLIDANALKKAIADAFYNLHEIAYIADIIERQSTVEAEPVRHGRWIQTTLKGYYECSACGYEHTSNPDQRFCSYCGARMNGGDAG